MAPRRDASLSRIDGSSPAEAAGPLQVLQRTFSVLAMFTVQRPEWTTTEIARACGLPIPTAHRILSALQIHGFVARDEAKRFHLGTAALEIGERARAVVDLRSLALPALRQLARESGETALLTVPSRSGDRSVCLERVESAQPLRLSVEPGRQLPLHAGASQKILLAFMPPQDIDRILAAPLDRLCRATITHPRALRHDLDQIRQRGWATSFEETNAGAWGLAVAVVDRADGVIAGLGLAGPSARLSPAGALEHLPGLHHAAEQVAGRLGAHVVREAWGADQGT